MISFWDSVVYFSLFVFVAFWVLPAMILVSTKAAVFGYHLGKKRFQEFISNDSKKGK